MGGLPGIEDTSPSEMEKKPILSQNKYIVGIYLLNIILKAPLFNCICLRPSAHAIGESFRLIQHGQ